ncbi:MAG: agmatine deiminase family protein [Arenibacterium sp.]
MTLEDAPPSVLAGLGDRRYARSCIRFYLANGAVVMPGFGVHEDAKAKATLADNFPDLKIVQVGISTLAAGGGGIHDVTRQEPIAIAQNR